MNSKIQDVWDCFALHTWLILSSYGIIFAIFSFFEDLGKKDNSWLKGTLSIIIGIIFYIFIGLRHLEGGQKRLNNKT
jgi:hypothetical protein